jgi:hypothetical protein
MSNIIIPHNHKATYRAPEAVRARGVDAHLIDSPQITANELLMAKTVAESLHKHYPGHLWAVSIEDARIIIKDLYLSGEWGYALHIPRIYSISSLVKDCLTAGGEILERFRQARSGMRVADIADLPTDFSGRHKPEL